MYYLLFHPYISIWEFLVIFILLIPTISLTYILVRMAWIYVFGFSEKPIKEEELNQ